MPALWRACSKGGNHESIASLRKALLIFHSPHDTIVDVRGVKGLDAVNEATRRAVETFEAACEQVGIVHGGIARVDTMTDQYLDRWITQEPKRYAGVSEVADLLGVSRQRVAQLRTKPGFPAPIAELRSGPIWDAASLGLFLEEWERRPGRPRRARSA